MKQDGAKRIRIGSRIVGRRPLIVGVVTSLEALSRVARRKSWPFDVVEVRLDLLKAGADNIRAGIRRIEDRGLPVLLTIRSAREKGGWRKAEAARARLYEELLPEVSAVDVEIRSPIFISLCRKAHEAWRTVVGSYHDFAGTPSLAVLKAMARRARAGGADIVKIATAVKGAGDAEVLLRLLKTRRGTLLCVIGMGTHAADLRVKLACEGACLTYGFVDRSAAPGQLACRELARRLRACGVRPA